MYFYILLFGLFFSCTAPLPPKTVILPLTKNSGSETQEKTIYTMGYMSEYDIWEFLRANPSERDVIETFGLPDSVWLDDMESTKFLYYFISELQKIHSCHSFQDSNLIYQYFLDLDNTIQP